ncbi:hypothetical protein SAMN06265795_11958 [Noviherbaspirillum humi]|uniref:Uncharacterized protein n=1 Tax=Noviherbaspirillum humi TaxID=1688639 RepID=A0A239L6B5_9BURK|nr:hypothetical protein [Noviherbaspirillum humi]SNT25458.1 hypothetical protein SAMN06265795_11958 [Noviherbaspirillum humi]
MERKHDDRQVAQPAEEEIKKHGDQLQRQVRDAAGGPPQPQGDQQARQTDAPRSDRR